MKSLLEENTIKEQTLHDAMVSAGFINTPEHLAPGKTIRFSTNGKPSDKAGWIRLFPDEQGAVFGCWREGTTHTWQAKRDKPLSKKEQSEFRKKVKEANEIANKEREEAYNAAALKANNEFWSCSQAPESHPYLKAKCVLPHDARVDDKGWLIIPIYGANGDFQSLQRIAPFIDKDNHYQKRFFTGGKTKMVQSWLGEPKNGDILMIAEGFSSAASPYEATNYAACIAFSASNLADTAKIVRYQYPDSKILILGDNDIKNKNNTGKDSADTAAKSIGAMTVFPLNYKDFNDMAQAEGLNTVRECIEKALSVADINTLNNDINIDKADQFPGGWEDALDKHVEMLNKTHAQVITGGKHRVMRTVPSGANHDNRESYEFLSRNELSLAYANTSIKVGEKIVRGETVDICANHIMAWAKHKDSRVYIGGLVFKPVGKVPDGYFNTWQGFTVKPEQGGAWALIKKHIEEVVCAGDQELIDYFYNWTAYTLQKPNKPAGAALVLRGEKGAGKGVLGHFLRGIWGNHALHISTAKHLVGNFNGHLNDVCFLFADEAFYSGDKQHEGVLKALITEPTITIERKGIDATSQPNYLKVFMATNSDYAVPASKDERRYCVFDVSSTMKGNKAYFDALRQECKDKSVQAAFLYDMLDRDISQFHTGHIPESVGLKEQRYHSLPPAGKWLADSLINGTFGVVGFNSEGWHSDVSSGDLWKSYLNWCDQMKIGEFKRDNQIGLSKYIKTIFRKCLVGSSRLSGFTFGTVDDAIHQFETIEKVTLPKQTLS